MALTADRNTFEREGKLYEYPLAASVECFVGALLVLDASGNCKPGVAATGLIAVGRCEEYAKEATGVAAASSVKVKSGVFKWKNSGTNVLTKANIGDTVFIEDDQTVGSLSTAMSAAGILVDIESDGVWVKTEPPVTLSSTGLLAANNLSDVGTAATARANIGANKVVLSLRATSLVGTTVYGVVSPVAGTIAAIHSVLKGAALTTGNATLTGKIGGTAITGGVVTITQAGSAIGDKDSATPSALNVVAVGDEIQFLVGGTNDEADAFAEISLLITT